MNERAVIYNKIKRIKPYSKHDWQTYILIQGMEPIVVDSYGDGETRALLAVRFPSATRIEYSDSISFQGLLPNKSSIDISLAPFDRGRGIDYAQKIRLTILDGNDVQVVHRRECDHIDSDIREIIEKDGTIVTPELIERAAFIRSRREAIVA